MTNREDIEQRLARLTGETAALRPSAGFSARVMQAIDGEALRTKGDAVPAKGFWETAWLSSRRLVPLAAVAAVLAVGWAIHVESSVDDALATSYASVGFE